MSMKNLGLIGIGVLAIALFIWSNSGETTPEATPAENYSGPATTQLRVIGKGDSADHEVAAEKPDYPLKSKELDTRTEPAPKTREVPSETEIETFSPEVVPQLVKSRATENGAKTPADSGRDLNPLRIPSPPRPISETQAVEETPPSDSNEVAEQKVIVAPSPPRRSPEGTLERPGPIAVTNVPERTEPRTAILPAGSVIEVRTVERISSKSNATGDTFEATLAGDLSVNGKVIISRGTEVTGRLQEVIRPGKVKGRGSVTFDLQEIRGLGTAYALKTNSITIESESSKGKDAAKVGAATAIGAVLGAVFGGKKGAAIGGATAGGAGAAGVLLSRGKDVEIPAERLFSFRLEEEVEIQFW